MGQGAEAPVVADLDELHAPVEHLGQRLRRGARATRRASSSAAGPAPPGGRAAGPRQARDGPRAPAASRPTRALRSPKAAAPSAMAPASTTQPLRAPSGDGRHERRQLGQGPALVGAGGIAGAGEDAVGPAVEQEPGHRQRIGRLRARRDRAPAAPGRGGDEWRERPFRGRDHGQATGRRGGDGDGRAGGPGGRGRHARWAARSGSAAATRASSRCDRRVGIGPRRAARPSRADARRGRRGRSGPPPVVAAPRSMARKARGSLAHPGHATRPPPGRGHASQVASSSTPRAAR